MKISSISKYKGNTYCVEFYDSDRIYLNSNIISEFNLKDGMTLPEAAVDEIIEANNFRKARERALYLLDVRDYSYSELYKKLLQNYPDETCLNVCNKMSELGLINDLRYAENKARQLFEVKKVGVYKAKQELRLKGLANDVIEAAIEPYLEEDDVLERLEELVEKKYERYLVDEKGVNKVKAALQRKGYSYSDINAVLDLYEFDF